MGSNAVVVKDVPAGATVVGVPAHEVVSRQAKASEFDSYATQSGAADPLSFSIEKLMQEVSALKSRVQELEGEKADEGETAKKWGAK